MAQARYFFESTILRMVSHNEGTATGPVTTSTVALYTDSARTALASTYQSRTGGTLRDNPLTPDSTGRVWCYVAAGRSYYWQCGEIYGEFFAATDTFDELDVPTITMDSLDVDTLDVNGPATIDSGLTLGGNLTPVLGTLPVAGSISATGDIAVGDDLTVTDDVTVGGDLAVTGTLSSGAATLTALTTGNVTVTGGTINITSLVASTVQANTSLKVSSGGAVITAILKGTATWDPTSTTSGTTTTVTVTGAAVGDLVIGIYHTGLTTGFGAHAVTVFQGFVSAADTVTVAAISASGASVDLPSGTLTVLVAKVT